MVLVTLCVGSQYQVGSGAASDDSTKGFKRQSFSQTLYSYLQPNNTVVRTKNGRI